MLACRRRNRCRIALSGIRHSPLAAQRRGYPAKGSEQKVSDSTERMSALGQKQTYAVHKLMSALHPIATAKADSRKRSCPLYPRKRTCAVQNVMSAKGQ